MTVKLLQQFGKYPDGALYTADATTEAAMVTAGLATATLTGGTVYPPTADPGAATPATWSQAEKAGVQALVSGAWNRFNVNAAPGASAVFRVMQAPPTVTLTGTNPLSSGQLFASTNQTGVASNNFSYYKAGRPTVAGTNNDSFALKFRSTLYDTGASSNSAAVGVIHDGTRIAFIVIGHTTNLLVRVDDQYTSLTPVQTANDSAIYYVDVLFANRGQRRVELLGDSSLFFAGAWIGANDTIEPAPIRGPRVIVQGDSFTEGTGSECNQLSWVQAFAEFMGWDDVWPSGVGATGYIAAPGLKKTIDGRAATDLFPFSPDIVLDAAGINDNGQTYAAVLAAVTTRWTNVAANLPATAKRWSIPCFWNRGVATMGTILTVRQAIRDAATPFGVQFIDLLEMPMQPSITPLVGTLNGSVTAGATTFSSTVRVVEGATYKFADNTRFVAKSQSGYSPTTVTVDGSIVSSEASGATFTQCGNSFWTGVGYSAATTGYGNADLYAISSGNVHPNGSTTHKAIGIAVGQQAYALLR